MNKFWNVNWTKYNSKKTVVDWIKFDSQLESRFYVRLLANVNVLELQTRFVLQDKFKTKEWKSIRAIEYVCDFKIEVNWDIYYVDSKWREDSVFKLKHKLWLHRYWDENILLVCKSIKDLCLKLWIDYIK